MPGTLNAILVLSSDTLTDFWSSVFADFCTYTGIHSPKRHHIYCNIHIYWALTDSQSNGGEKPYRMSVSVTDADGSACLTSAVHQEVQNTVIKRKGRMRVRQEVLCWKLIRSQRPAWRGIAIFFFLLQKAIAASSYLHLDWDPKRLLQLGSMERNPWYKVGFHRHFLCTFIICAYKQEHRNPEPLRKVFYAYSVR